MTNGMDARYDEDYFIKGRETGKSLYENYRWLPDLTIPMVRRMIAHCGIDGTDRICDFGCARGYIVKAFHQLGYDAYGYDISEWALKNADPEIAHRVSNEWPTKPIDWIIAKDVLEHIQPSELFAVIKKFREVAKKGMFIVVPLSAKAGDAYEVPDYDADVTHVVRWPLWRWVVELNSVLGYEWEISSRYRVHGIKDNYARWVNGNGFITVRRITEV